MSRANLHELVRPATIAVLARKEIRDALRNKWFLLYAAAFAVLATAISFLSLAGTNTFGGAGWGRTAASLVNLVILIVPLMGLTAGAGALATERESGTLAYLLAQPVNRFEVMAGKFIGIGIALTAALAIGFGIAAALIAPKQAGDPAGLAALFGLSCVLAIAALSVGLLLSTVARRAGVALGAAVVVWLAMTVLGDLGLMGTTLIFEIEVRELFALSLVNPPQVFKMAALSSLNASLDVLGPAGVYAQQTHGASLAWIFGGALGAWVIIPLAVSFVLFAIRGEP